MKLQIHYNLTTQLIQFSLRTEPCLLLVPPSSSQLYVGLRIVVQSKNCQHHLQNHSEDKAGTQLSGWPFYENPSRLVHMAERFTIVGVFCTVLLCEMSLGTR